MKTRKTLTLIASAAVFAAAFPAYAEPQWGRGARGANADAPVQRAARPAFTADIAPTLRRQL